MGDTLRQSMAWLHTWTGVVIGALLFAIFWMGTLSVFDHEIDRWMMPMTRLAAPAAPPSLDMIADTAARIVPPGSSRWQAVLPTARQPVVTIDYQDAGGAFITRHTDPTTGALLPEAESWAGTGFIFPFHVSLHIRWMELGDWLVGLVGMAMLVLLISGVVIHRKIFVQFFTFRPDRKLPRASLDLHNLTGVLALPFHLMMTLSGLIIFFSLYFPTVISTVYQGDSDAFFKDTYGVYRRDQAGKPAVLASLEAMAQEASQLWDGRRPSFVRVWHPGDVNSTVEMRRWFVDDAVTVNRDVLYFDGPTGAVLHTHTARPVMNAQSFIAGLHFIQFEHWTLRWIYFVLGLSGCVTIATGLIVWLEARRKHHAKLGLPGVRIVEGLTIGSVTGILIATLAFFIANRLLPLGASFAGYERAALEVWVFYLVWLATFAHAWLRPASAWREQCWVIAGLAVLAVVLNGITTGDHLLKTITDGYWPVAGMDLMLFAGGAVAALTALRLQHRQKTAVEGAARHVQDPAQGRHV